jgi:chromosomal replication initiation ATPase DnaA
MTGQLPFDLPHNPRFSEEDFLEAPSNKNALAMVRLWPDWPQKALLLLGPRGSGKSHLGAIWARRAGARVFSAKNLQLDLLPDLVAGPALLLEDADAVESPEADMFHLLNMAAEKGVFVLITAQKNPDHWGVATPDLLSRLRRAPTVAIAAPDEAFLRAILVKLFYDRQIRVDETVVDFLALRLERSFEAAQKIVAALDREGLARGRPVTRPLAAAVLNAQNDADSNPAAQKDFFDSDG